MSNYEFNTLLIFQLLFGYIYKELEIESNLKKFFRLNSRAGLLLG